MIRHDDSMRLNVSLSPEAELVAECVGSKCCQGSALECDVTWLTFQMSLFAHFCSWLFETLEAASLSILTPEILKEAKGKAMACFAK